MNFLLNSNLSLDYSEGCIIRGPEDLMHLVSPSMRRCCNKSILCDSKFALLDRFLAADISFALRHYQWLISHSSADPLIDCRTSSWKSLINSESKTPEKIIDDMDGIRACTANLRSLYLYNECHMNRYRLYNIHSYSSMMQWSFGSGINCISPSLYICNTDSNFTNALKWATPSISWHGRIKLNYEDYSQLKNGCVESNYPVEYDLLEPDQKIYAIGFQSPFAKAYISSVLTGAESIISRNAYLHRFCEKSITCDDLLSALEVLRSRCKQ